MKKQNNSRLLKTYSEVQFPTELWWNDETKKFDLWRNHKVVYTFFSPFELTDEEAINEADRFVEKTEHEVLTLNEYLSRNNIKITQLEIDSLEAILSEGSFYAECGSGPDERGKSCFFGWCIDESEVPGCRGALSSLQKKGIVNIVYDNSFYGRGPQAAYYTYVKFEFIEGSDDRLKIDEENRK